MKFLMWLNVGLKTRLISMTILILSILMSTFAFFTLFRIQSELVNTDKRFCIDFSIILANDIVHFLETNNSLELNNFEKWPPLFFLFFRILHFYVFF